MIRIAFVGQPNCGKSTIFNHLVGYKAHTSNFPGTTVEFLASDAIISGVRAELVDLPGVYSLTSTDEAEEQTRDYLLHEPVDVIFHIVDASLLSRSLELTLQLLEFGIPMVLCLNMEDEARRKGIQIDAEALASTLGIPAIPTIGVRGIGVQEAAQACIRAHQSSVIPKPPTYSKDVEEAIAALEREIDARAKALSKEKPHHASRLTAVKLMENDTHFVAMAGVDEDGLEDRVAELAQTLARQRGRRPEAVLAAERHARAMEIFESVAQIGRPVIGLRDRLDAILMHRAWGLIALGGIMYALFFAVFHLGKFVEEPLLALFERASLALGTVLAEGSVGFAALSGLIQGIGGALGIVLPYLLPFLLGLALLEDVGYLPRAGYLVDGLMHRIGLHGKSVIPFILGYGCSVPAVMATRILESKRDRFITAMLSTMVPCVARATIIFGLIGYFLGPHLAFLLYVVNLLVIGVVGKLLTRMAPGAAPGLILEIPSYKVPSLHVIAAKVWLRIRGFLHHALPILVIGSVALALLEVIQATDVLNAIARPFTWILGLPAAVGVTLIFGVFRKELSLVMLFQALGTTQILSVLSGGQMLTFTLFVIFYVPCIATIAVLRREIGGRQTALVVVATTGIALIVALLGRAFSPLLA